MEWEDGALTPEETHGCCYISTQSLKLKMENRFLRKKVKHQEALIEKLLLPPKKEVLLGEPSVVCLAGSWDGCGGAGGADETIQVLDFHEDDIKIMPVDGDEKYGLLFGTSQDLNTPKHEGRSAQVLDSPVDDIKLLKGLDFPGDDLMVDNGDAAQFNIVEQADPLKVPDFPVDDIKSIVTVESSSNSDVKLELDYIYEDIANSENKSKISQTCPCGKAFISDLIDINSSSGIIPLCGEICGKVYECTPAHSCQQTCHPESCPPCPYILLKHCKCKKTTIFTGCGTVVADCSKVCQKRLPCGVHRYLRLYKQFITKLLEISNFLNSPNL